MGQGRRHPRRGRARPRDHRRGHPRPLGHRQGRRRHPRRPHRRHRQGRATPTSMDGVAPRPRDRARRPRSSPGNGQILTAGAIDCHVHLICPQIIDEALGGGITTVIGGGTGPAEGTKATTVTPGAWHLARMLEALDAWPVNVALLGKGNTVADEALGEQLRGGRGRLQAARGLGHDAGGDRRLPARRRRGRRAGRDPHRHAQRGRLRRVHARARSPGRTIHAYHTEGAGGGHAPDIITVAGRSQRAAVSRPTRPGRTRSTPSTSTSTC